MEPAGWRMGMRKGPSTQQTKQGLRTQQPQESLCKEPLGHNDKLTRLKSGARTLEIMQRHPEQWEYSQTWGFLGEPLGSLQEDHCQWRGLQWWGTWCVGANHRLGWVRGGTSQEVMFALYQNHDNKARPYPCMTQHGWISRFHTQRSSCWMIPVLEILEKTKVIYSDRKH